MDYDHTRPYRRQGRPLTDLYCHGVRGPLPSPVHFVARLDTGADHLVLPLQLVQQLGIRKALLQRTRVMTASGPTDALELPNFLVEFEGIQIQVLAQFMNTQQALIGLEPLLMAMELGFDGHQWFFK